MDPDIALILLQDGIVNGAVYALLALSLVLVFAVTRVVLIPQGEFVAYGALTYAALDDGRVPGSIWLLAALGVGAMLAGLGAARRVLTPGTVLRLAAETLLVPVLVLAAVLLAPRKPGVLVEALLTLAIVMPMAPYIYRLAYQPLAEASVLVLLIASIGVHLALLGLGLVFFGPEGYRADGFSDARFDLGGLAVSGQSLWIVGATLALMAALYLFFERTLAGKALRATAVNRLGARLVGIETVPVWAGRLPAGRRHRRAVRHPDRAAGDGVLRHRVPGGPQGLRGRDHRRAGQLPRGGAGGGAGGMRGEPVLVLCQRLQGGDRVHGHHSRPALALAPRAGGGGVTRLLPFLVAALWLCVPFVPGVPNFWVTLANYAGLAAIVGVGLVVLTGYGGMTSFGQATFMGFGAYATAILTTGAGWSPWLTLPVALLASGAAALLIGAVTLRLSGHYLALGTIAWSVSLFYVFGNLDLFGRNDGISGIPPLRLGELALTSSRSYFIVVWLAVGLVLLLTRNLLDSRQGRAIRALRGGAAAAASFGVDLPGTRVLAFTYAAVLAGLAGWLYAHMQRSVNPTPFGLSAGIDYLLMVVLGGAGSVWGALLGAGLVTVLQDILQDVLPKLLGQQGNYEGVVFGAILVLVLQTSPEGLWPHVRRLSGWLHRGCAGLTARIRRCRRQRMPRPAHVQPRPPAPALPSRTLPVRGAPVLAAAGLRKTFGGLVAVNDIALHLDAGEIVGLIGPNGAGKSTTFNLLTGVARPTAGQIRFMGQDMSRCTPPHVAALGIARSFQHVKLVPGMSVLENVALGAHLRGTAGPVRALLRLDRAEEAGLMAEARRQIARVGLAAHASQRADSLALGQQRVVEIARALCLDPVLLLLDEPAAGLRHAEKAELAALLRRLRDDGMTVLLVEHDMDFVMNLAGRLIVMEFGAKLSEGAPAAVRADPKVVEAYLGAAA